MKTQINSAIISAFQDLFSPYSWQNLIDVFKNEGYKNVFVRTTTFENPPEIDIKTCIYFSDHELFESFLENEHKLAMNVQDFEWAAIIHEKQKKLNPDVKTFEQGVLKFTVMNKGKGACEVLFETNILSFKYKFIEEFISYGKMM